MFESQKALAALTAAREDVAKLEELSNQFRTCFLVVAAPPSGSLTGDPEIKNFMEIQRSRYENMELEELISIIDALQTHLTVFGRLTREKSKIKIAGEVAERSEKQKRDVENLRARQDAKREGKIFADPETGETEVTNPLEAGTEPVDKKMHKAIQGIMKTLKCDYKTAKKMVEQVKI